MPVSNRNRDFKRCGRCQHIKSLNEFGKVKGKVRSYCRECHAAANYIPDLRSEKQCSCCKEMKPVSEFTRQGARYYTLCKVCVSLRGSRIRAEQKDAGINIEVNRRDYWQRRRWIRLLSKYGVTKERYLQMVEEQGNLCAICRQPETETSSPHIDEMELSVDHCHETGQVRGLLCRQCNIALGKFKEDIEVLKSAIAYLARYV